MKTYKLPIVIVLQITEEDIEDIVDTALDCGIFYWCERAKYTSDPCGDTDGKHLINGGTILFYDNEDGSETELTLDKLLDGIDKWVAKGYDRYHAVQSDGTLDTCEIDAEMADIIFQFALFGDIIYG
jgi:ABC-type phosphate transport system substrate-binding protein